MQFTLFNYTIFAEISSYKFIQIKKTWRFLSLTTIVSNYFKRLQIKIKVKFITKMPQVMLFFVLEFAIFSLFCLFLSPDVDEFNCILIITP